MHSASPRRIGAPGNSMIVSQAGSSIAEPVVHSNGSLGRGLGLQACPTDDSGTGMGLGAAAGSVL